MLLSDPTTKKAASAKAETWRQEIFDICPTFSDRAPRRTCVVAPRDGRPRRIHSEGDANFRSRSESRISRQMDANLIRGACIMPRRGLSDDNACRGYVLAHMVELLGLLSNPGLNGFGVANAFKGDLKRSLHD